MRELYFAVAVVFLVLIFGACGAGQLHVSEAQVKNFTTRVVAVHAIISVACADLDDATDKHVDLCLAAEDVYDELLGTLSALSDAIRAAEGKEDPNVENIIELTERATLLVLALEALGEELAGS